MTICRTLIIAYRINKFRFHLSQYREGQPPVGFDRRLRELLYIVMEKEEFEKRAIKKATQSRLQELR